MNSQTQVESYLLAPNLYLFAYQLHDKKVEGKANPFWSECDRLLKIFQPELTLTPHLDFTSTANSDRTVLLNNQAAVNFTFTNSPDISGYAQPLQIKESYALFFNIGYDDEKEPLETVDFDKIKQFNPEQALLFPEHDKFLGQTFLITAYLPTPHKQSHPEYLQNLSNQFYQTLFGEDTPIPYRSSEIWGSPIFEYGNPSKIKNAANYPHVLVWLFRDEQASLQANKCLNYLTDLLFYRIKITKAFHDSRLIYQELDKAYCYIEDKLDSLQKELDTPQEATKDDSYLKDFKTHLKELAKESLPYTRLLRKMEDFGNTIEINLYNYNELIDRICVKLKIHQKELSFLKYFGQETAPHFRTQIQADLGYFEHGTDLIDQAIASIRGIVEIDQAERDRDRQQTEKDLQNKIQAVGVGIAAGAIFASTSGLITQPWYLPNGQKMELPLIPHPFLIGFLGSTICSIGAWYFAKKWISEGLSLSLGAWWPPTQWIRIKKRDRPSLPDKTTSHMSRTAISDREPPTRCATRLRGRSGKGGQEQN